MADYGRWTSNGGDPSLNEINRVDQFIEALSSNRQVYSTDPEEAELAFLFADWRDGVRETPVSALVTEQDAVLALRAGQSSTRRPGRGHLAVVGSAAAAVMCLGGFGAAVYGAGPGDGLYGVRSMLFGDQQVTRDDQVVLAAQTELAEVQQLIEQGQWDQAQDKLVALSTTVQSVEQVESKHDLIEQWNALTYKVVEQDPAATLPPVGDPMPALPDSPLTLLPVPVVDTTSPSVPASPSDTSLPLPPTDTTGPEVMLTPPSDSSVPPTSVPTTSPTAPSSAPSTETSTPPSSAPSSTTSTTTTSTSTSTTTTGTTATSTTTTTRPPAPAVGAPPPASQPPASQPASPPRVAPSPPASTAPVQAEAPSSQTTSQPAPVTTSTVTSTVREESADADSGSDTPVTTTVVAPGGGE